MSNRKVLVTGSAGFIGYHLSKRLMEEGDRVVGLDNVNDYYDVNLKNARLKRLEAIEGFEFRRLSLEDRSGMEKLFGEHSFDVVVNLAAQAGVRYSLVNPHAYCESNLIGFTHILEGCRHSAVKHLVFASSSSVYGSNTKMPFSVDDSVDHPLSLYAATKKANELMAHTYAHLYGLPCTGLRFFTVYGPWGRPDMALFIFTKAMLEGKPVPIFNNGMMRRDFTYIDDIVEGVVRVMGKQAVPDPEWTPDAPRPSSSKAPYRVYNIGNHNPVELMEFIEAIEEELGIKAEKQMLPMQPGDVSATWADVSDLTKDFGFKPSTSVRDGIREFVRWYREYYNK